MDAIRKMTLTAGEAPRGRVPAMKTKGNIAAAERAVERQRQEQDAEHVAAALSEHGHEGGKPSSSYRIRLEVRKRR